MQTRITTVLFSPAPAEWGHYAIMTVVRLSVRLSVRCLTLSRERKGVGNTVNDKKEAHDTGHT